MAVIRVPVGIAVAKVHKNLGQRDPAAAFPLAPPLRTENVRFCRARYVSGFAVYRGRAQCLGMMTSTELPSVPGIADERARHPRSVGRRSRGAATEGN